MSALGNEPWFLVVLAVLYGGSRLYERLDVADQEESDVDAARRAYVAGEISVEEMERRLDRALDPRAQEIRDRVEHVEHVGPETSGAIADHFDSLDELEDATTDDLEEVHGVGPSTATAIRGYFQEKNQ